MIYLILVGFLLTNKIDSLKPTQHCRLLVKEENCTDYWNNKCINRNVCPRSFPIYGGFGICSRNSTRLSNFFVLNHLKDRMQNLKLISGTFFGHLLAQVKSCPEPKYNLCDRRGKCSKIERFLFSIRGMLTKNPNLKKCACPSSHRKECEDSICAIDDVNCLTFKKNKSKFKISDLTECVSEE